MPDLEAISDADIEAVRARGAPRADTQARMDELLATIPRAATIAAALAACGIHEGTYSRWRARYPDFKRAANKASMEMSTRKHRIRVHGGGLTTFDPERATPRRLPFSEWRPIYTGRQVELHQEGFVDAWEDTTNRIVIWLAPTGAGKDTTAGDIVLRETTEDRTLRTAWFMESESLAKRRVAERIKPYLEDQNTYRAAPLGATSQVPEMSLIEDYGPFTWQKGMEFPDGTPVPKNTWLKQELYFLRGLGEAEADPNLWASGFGGRIYGARIQLLTVSDAFTRENQRNPNMRAEQIELFESGGTIATRLDGSGRQAWLGTRVAHYDNYGQLIERWTKGAVVIDHRRYHNTDYWKYSNGVAVVITRAIDHDEDGNEVPFWPTNPEFPLDDELQIRDANGNAEERHLIAALTDAERHALTRRGAVYVQGLRSKREESPERFEASQQQNPPATEGGEFTDLLLNHCDDPTRSVGQYFAHETLVLGVDPARTYGAAWVLLAYDPHTETATVVDSFFGTKLGTEGIRRKLLLEPATTYWPAYIVYETNQHSGILDHPEIKNLISQAGFQLVPHRTGLNRSQGEAAVAMMTTWMRAGRFRFPAATTDDRSDMGLIKQHFQNWDSATQTHRTSGPGKSTHAPDDLCMATWIAWHHISTRMKRGPGGTARVMHRRVPADVRSHYQHTMPVASPVTMASEDEPDPYDMVGWYHYRGA